MRGPGDEKVSAGFLGVPTAGWASPVPRAGACPRLRIRIQVGERYGRVPAVRLA
jgi:hypothetical protein